MTEDEAKKKSCFRASTFDASNSHPVRFCIGSACMAWRGKETAAFAHKAEAEFWQSGMRLTPTAAEMEGFCGLAGVPA